MERRLDSENAEEGFGASGRQFEQEALREFIRAGKLGRKMLYGNWDQFNWAFGGTLRLIAGRGDFDVVDFGKVPFGVDQNCCEEQRKEHQQHFGDLCQRPTAQSGPHVPSSPRIRTCSKFRPPKNVVSRRNTVHG